MRIVSFSKKWDKLEQAVFTTFRFPRKDRDWGVGEIVQVYYKNRTPQREHLFDAEITGKDLRKIATVHEEYLPSEEEAKEDGFDSLLEFNRYFSKTYGSRIFEEPIHKLTLRRKE